jgi:hypothetical protein
MFGRQHTDPAVVVQSITIWTAADGASLGEAVRYDASSSAVAVGGGQAVDPFGGDTKFRSHWVSSQRQRGCRGKGFQ